MARCQGHKKAPVIPGLRFVWAMRAKGGGSEPAFPRNGPPYEVQTGSLLRVPASDGVVRLLAGAVEGELALLDTGTKLADEVDHRTFAERAHQVGEGGVQGGVGHQLGRDAVFGGFLPGIENVIERLETILAVIGECQHDLPPSPHRIRLPPGRNAPPDPGPSPRNGGSDPETGP